MRYYRCRCGQAEAYGSYGPADCHGCTACNTTLETHPDLHREIQPHEWGDPEWRIEPRTGDRWRVRRCVKCNNEQKVPQEYHDVRPPLGERRDGGENG